MTTRRRRGAEAVEFAMVLPVLLAVVLGVIEWGWYLDREAALVQAVRDAAWTGSLTAAEDDPRSAAEARLRDVLARENFSSASNATAALVSGPFGDAIRVTVSVPYQPLVRGMQTPPVLVATHVALMDDR